MKACVRPWMLFATSRGDCMESFEYSSLKASAVFIVGIPFQQYGTKKIDAKKYYMDKKFNLKGAQLSFQDWYQEQAIHEVNQHISKVLVKEAESYAVFLIDSRFATSLWQINCMVQDPK